MHCQRRSLVAALSRLRTEARNMKQYKQPVSVLVVIYTVNGEVLLLERADYPGYWQSVTGSREAGETLTETAIREVHEETGLDARNYPLSDWQSQNIYEIYPQWRYRYPPDTTHNTEHVFGLQLPHLVDVKLEPREHLNFQWLAWRDAAEKVFSPSNRAAILELPQRIQTNARVLR
jgi:dihydroneopterin triphosphate diphosphatase